jgi:hypothetical protein
MKKWISLLAGLLVVQLLLAVAVHLGGEDRAAFRAEEPMLAFDRQAVDGLRITADGKSVTLKREGGDWTLPDRDGFPADGKVAEALLDQLAALRKGWPVATTDGARKRFKVADEDFERKLELLAGGKAVATLYLGTSPGLDKVHVRPAGDGAVYAVAFESWRAEADSSQWLDKTVLQLKAGDIQRLEMPGLVLKREEDGLRLEGLAEGESTDAKAAESLLERFAGLRIQDLLGHEAKAEYRQEQPELELTLQLSGGETLVYRFSKPEQGGYYVLKRSDRPEFFKLAEYQVDPIRETTREKLLAKEEKERKEPAPAG